MVRGGERTRPPGRDRMRALARRAALAALIGVGSCGPRLADNPFVGTRGGEPVVFEVENRHWADMTISVRRGGTRSRLGLVSTNQRRTFTLSAVVAPPGASVEFVADPVGSNDAYRSPVVSLMAGDHYIWTLAVDLVHSTLVRR